MIHIPKLPFFTKSQLPPFYLRGSAISSYKSKVRLSPRTNEVQYASEFLQKLIFSLCLHNYTLAFWLSVRIFFRLGGQKTTDYCFLNNKILFLLYFLLFFNFRQGAPCPLPPVESQYCLCKWYLPLYNSFFLYQM